MVAGVLQVVAAVLIMAIMIMVAIQETVVPDMVMSNVVIMEDQDGIQEIMVAAVTSNMVMVADTVTLEIVILVEIMEEAAEISVMKVDMATPVITEIAEM